MTLRAVAGGGGSGSAGGSSGQLQYNNGGSFGGAAQLVYAASGTNLTITATGTDTALSVVGATGNVFKSTINSTDYSSTAPGAINMYNLSATGQNCFNSYVNGTLVARWRTDNNSNTNFISYGTGDHAFFTGGDYTVGVTQVAISHSGWLGMSNNVALGWASNAAPAGSLDTTLYRGAAGVIGFQGQSSSFPGLKRSAAKLICRLADDSADAVFQASTFAIASNNLLTGQSTGYGTPTGGAKQASFAAGSITLPNLAACVAQLIIDLKAGQMPAT